MKSIYFLCVISIFVKIEKNQCLMWRDALFDINSTNLVNPAPAVAPANQRAFNLPE